MSPIEAVLFDYGLVLTGPADPAAWAGMKLVLGADESPYHEAYWAFRHAYDRGELSGLAYWHAVAERTGRSATESQVAELIALDTELWTQPNEEMIAWAARLQRAGVKTGILSNLGDAMETGILERFAWLGGFNHHTFSHRLRLAKPERAIYLHAANGLGCAPKKVLFIDDREENISGARAAGMVTIQYTGHDAFIAEMRRLSLDHLLNPGEVRA